MQEALLLARSGEQSLVASLELALNAEQEDRDAVWDVISMVIADVRRFVEHDNKLVNILKRSVNTLINPQLAQLGYTSQPGDSSELKKTPGDALWAGRLG